MQPSKSALLYVAIGLLIGAGSGYVFTRLQIVGLKSEIEDYKAQIVTSEERIIEYETKLSKAEGDLETLHVEQETLRIRYEILQREYESLQKRYEELEYNISVLIEKHTGLYEQHTALLNILNITEVKEYTQTINYTIYSGNETTWTFFLPYGALWDATIYLAYDYCGMSHSWRQGETRTFAGSSGRALSQYGLTGIPFLTGTITLQYYDDGGPTIYVQCTILSQYAELSRKADGWIQKIPS